VVRDYWAVGFGVLVGQLFPEVTCVVLTAGEPEAKGRILATLASSGFVEWWWRWFYEDNWVLIAGVVAALASCWFLSTDPKRDERLSRKVIVFLSVALLFFSYRIGNACPRLLLSLADAGEMTLHQLSCHGVTLISESMVGLTVSGVLSLAALGGVLLRTGWDWYDTQWPGD
jgi:hypothetical protein